MSDDRLSESNPMVTETRIKVVNPLRKLFVGTDDGLFRLTGDVNPQASWAWRSDRFLEGDGRSVRCIAAEPGTGLLLVGFGMRGAGLQLSEDGGKTWGAAPGWPEDRPAWAVAATGAGRVVVGSAPADLYHGELPEGGWSANQSVQALPSRAEWSFVDGGEAHFTSFSNDPVSPNRWLATVEVGGVLVSEDQGATWRQVGGTWDAHVVVHTRGGVAVVATGEGLKRSLDGGESWGNIEKPAGYVCGLCVDVAGNLFAAVEGSGEGPVWTSTDKGHHWEPVASAAELPAPGRGVHALEADSLHPGVVYHGAGDKVFLVSAEGSREIAADLPDVRRLLVL